MRDVSDNWGTKEWFEDKFIDAHTRGDGWYIHLRASQSFRMQLCQDLIQGHVKARDGMHILDIGCGLGLFTERLSSANPNNLIYGCDISENAISFNQKRFPGFEFKVNSLPSLRYESEKFDIIYALEVIYYLNEKDQRASLEEIGRCLKRGGYFLISGGINRDERYFEERKIRELISEYFDIIDITYNNARIYGYLEKLFLGIIIMAGMYANGSLMKIDNYIGNRGITAILENRIFRTLANAPLRLLMRPTRYLLSNTTLVSACNHISELLLRRRGRTHIIILARKTCN